MWIGTSDGVIRCRTIHRKPTPDRWQKDKLEQLRGLPWDLGAPDPPGPSAEQELRPIVNDRQVGDPTAAEGEQEECDPHGEIRNFKIYKNDLSKPEIGYTPGCQGCSAARDGYPAKPHTQLCRERIRNILLEIPSAKARVEKADARLMKAVESRIGVNDPSTSPAPQQQGQKEVEMEEEEQNEGVNSEAEMYSPTSPASEDNASQADDISVGMLAAIAIEYIKYGKHVSEIYSPPRVTRIAKNIGLKSGSLWT